MSATLPDDPLSAADIQRLITPILSGPLPSTVCEKTARYVSLLYRWNMRMNLTAVRDPKTFVSLHLAESFFAAQSIAPGTRTLLDYGSGGGLPGIPIAMVSPHISVTLAESQRKKAAFLREALRVLDLGNVKVHDARVENMAPKIVFDAVIMRAVDNMEAALGEAIRRIRRPGWCVIMGSERDRCGWEAMLPALEWFQPLPVPGTSQRVVLRGKLGLAAG